VWMTLFILADCGWIVNASADFKSSTTKDTKGHGGNFGIK
jgi:hypothetical protein